MRIADKNQDQITSRQTTLREISQIRRYIAFFGSNTWYVAPNTYTTPDPYDITRQMSKRYLPHLPPWGFKSRPLILCTWSSLTRTSTNHLYSTTPTTRGFFHDKTRTLDESWSYYCCLEQSPCLKHQLLHRASWQVHSSPVQTTLVRRPQEGLLRWMQPLSTTRVLCRTIFLCTFGKRTATHFRSGLQSVCTWSA